MDYVLGYFGKTVRSARNAYFSFVETGLNQDRRDDLIGGRINPKSWGLVGSEASPLSRAGHPHIGLAREWPESKGWSRMTLW